MTKKQEAMKKCKETMLKKYGTSNPLQVKEFKEKRRQTLISHFGSESCFSDPVLLDARETKRITTTKKRYGVENPMQVREISQRCCANVKKTLKEKYGVNNSPFEIKEVQENVKEINFKKYGERVINPLQISSFRKKVLKVSPNKIEQKLIELITKNKLPIQFVADQHFSIKVKKGYKYPDFLVLPTLTKKVIELFGDYWHSEKIQGCDDEKLVVSQYKEVGYECLVVWEKELKDLSTTLNKITSFLAKSVETIRSTPSQGEDIVRTSQKCEELNRNI